MFWTDLICAAVVALVLSALLVGLTGWRYGATKSAWAGFVVLFLLLFVATWAASAWFGGWGPIAFGGYWLPFLVFGVVLAVALSAFVPSKRAMEPRPPGAAPEAPGDVAAMNEAQGSGAFVWILILVMAVLVVLAYGRGAA